MLVIIILSLNTLVCSQFIIVVTIVSDLMHVFLDYKYPWLRHIALYEYYTTYGSLWVVYYTYLWTSKMSIFNFKCLFFTSWLRVHKIFSNCCIMLSVSVLSRLTAMKCWPEGQPHSSHNAQALFFSKRLSLFNILQHSKIKQAWYECKYGRNPRGRLALPRHGISSPPSHTRPLLLQRR